MSNDADSPRERRGKSCPDKDTVRVKFAAFFVLNLFLIGSLLWTIGSGQFDFEPTFWLIPIGIGYLAFIIWGILLSCRKCRTIVLMTRPKGGFFAFSAMFDGLANTCPVCGKKRY